MASVWHTADLHIGHRLVSGLRGFADTDAHDAEIIERWTRDVRDGDIVYVLGDVAVSNPTRALVILNELPGRKRLISGNHDPVAAQHREAHRWFGAYLEVFEWVTPFARRRIAGQDVLLSHYPYATSIGADHGEVRYAQYRLPDLGEWLLHGHNHSTEVRTSEREIHVGYDAWRRLVPEHEIAALMEGSQA